MSYRLWLKGGDNFTSQSESLIGFRSSYRERQDEKGNKKREYFHSSDSLASPLELQSLQLKKRIKVTQ